MKKKSKLNIKSNWDKSINLSENELNDLKAGALSYACAKSMYLSGCTTSRECDTKVVCISNFVKCLG